MPALSGSLSYSRLFVPNELPPGFRDQFIEAISLRVMQPLDPNEEASERSGWCGLGEPLVLELDHERVYYGNYLNLGFRTDKWAIPGPLLRTKLREAEQAYLEKKGREKLAKREREELRHTVTRQLRKKLVPTIRTIDLSWSLDEKLVRFFTHSPRVIADMADLFAQTFGVDLISESPFTLKQRLGIDDDELRAWDSLEPTILGSIEEL